MVSRLQLRPQKGDLVAVVESFYELMAYDWHGRGVVLAGGPFRVQAEKTGR